MIVVDLIIGPTHVENKFTLRFTYIRSRLNRHKVKCNRDDEDQANKILCRAFSSSVLRMLAYVIISSLHN